MSTTALQFSGSAMPLRFSSVAAVGGKLTLEAWVRPGATDKQRAVIAVGGPRKQLVLAVSHELVALVAGEGAVTTICAGGTIKANEWAHVAVTFASEGNGLVAIALHHQGKQVASYQVARANTLAPHTWEFTSGLLRRPLLERCHLGGSVTGVAPFAGMIAEARLWGGVVGAADLAGRRGVRLRGDEPSLIGCYRLDEKVDGCLHDVSPQRGFALVKGGATLVEAPGLPLPATSGRDHVRLQVRGKLVREWLGGKTPTRPITGTLPSSGARGGGANLDDPQQRAAWRAEYSLFDATIEPRGPDGSSFAGKLLEIRLDAPLTAVVAAGTDTQLVQWDPGKVHTVAIPASGRVRLRFVAEGLRCADLRVRIEGMPAGLWTLVRPDGEALGGLRTVQAAALQKPSGGRASPLPAGASADDAAAFAELLRKLGTAMPHTPVHASGAQTRSIIDDVVDGGENLVESGGELINQGIDATTGAYNGLVATTTAAVAGAQRVAKTAGQLCVKAGAGLDDLVRKASSAPAQLGTTAIRTFVDRANTLAVVSRAAAGEVAHQLEIVGTSIVDGAEMVWRVVVAGVEDAIAAVTAIVERIGALVQKLVDFLAYLFLWADFLAASDQAFALYNRHLDRLPAYIASLARYKTTIAEKLGAAIDPALARQSIAQACGLDLDDDTPGVREINYVLEELDRVLGLLDFGAVRAAATGGAISGELATLAAGGDRAAALLPLDRGSPVALFTTPIGELFGGGRDAAGASTGLVDHVFAQVETSATAAVADGLAFLRRRLSVPYVTSTIEEVILGGRDLSILRMVSLIAGIASVLSDKLGGGSRSRTTATPRTGVAPRADAAVDGTSSTTTTEPAVGSPDDGAVFAALAAGLGGSLCLTLQTGFELTNLVTANRFSATAINLVNGTYAILTLLRCSLQAYIASYIPSRELRDCAAAIIALEGIGAFALAASSLARSVALAKNNAEAVKWIDRFDAGFQAVIAGGIGITCLVAIFTGAVNTKSQKDALALRTSAALASAITRAWSAFDNIGANGRKKQLTFGFLAVTAGLEISEAAYGYSQDIPAA